jgi:hypothetical protein
MMNQWLVFSLAKFSSEFGGAAGVNQRVAFSNLATCLMRVHLKV